MMANVNSEIDITKGIPTYESFKEHLETFQIEIHLEPQEFIRLFKNYVLNNLDIDLDELNVYTILDVKGAKLVLDIEYLEDNDPNELYFIMDEFKYHFGRSVFGIRAAMNLNVILRKILSNCNSYKLNDDGSFDVVYSLLDVTQNEIGQYINI